MPLLIKTILKPNIHGLGVFALEPIIKDQLVWQHDAIFDGWIHKNLLANTNPNLNVLREYVECLCPYDAEIECYIKACDNMNYINHSYNPNLSSISKYMHLAARDIEIDEELTINYTLICDLEVNSLGF
jgi:SET domain-containing protein